MRTGVLSGSAQVNVYTEDGCGKAGERYNALSQVVSFEPWEYTKTVDIEIVHSDAWAPTLEFKVKLDNPKGCELSKDLNVCRVKVIDNDVFPSGKYETEIRSGEGDIRNISGVGLFVEFCKLVFMSNKDMCWRTLLSIVLDQMKNCYMYFLLVAKAYLVNVVFNLKSHQLRDPHRIGLARAIGVFYMAPMVALHIWDFAKIGMDSRGRVRLWIRESLFRKYLNYPVRGVEGSGALCQDADRHHRGRRSFG
ncbi:unnamed protein product [Prorocentrum cordatum]|uniref:Calx-beta domain-containing protein n=1 Tax=Prorocentrum cordatum TaxID=2364126 RepID=A0ABN9VIY7_9DINO|nr:unnamed protein product [Polarella glacialis]